MQYTTILAMRVVHVRDIGQVMWCSEDDSLPSISAVIPSVEAALERLEMDEAIVLGQVWGAACV